MRNIAIPHMKHLPAQLFIMYVHELYKYYNFPLKAGSAALINQSGLLCDLNEIKYPLTLCLDSQQHYTYIPYCEAFYQSFRTNMHSRELIYNIQYV